MPQTTISSATFPPLSVERTTTSTDGYIGSYRIIATSSGDMVDGYGVNQTYWIKDTAGVNNEIAKIGARRSGADNSGRLVFSTFTTGTDTEKMTIMPNGNVGIGTTAPTNTLDINSTAIASSRENLFRAKVSDDSTSSFGVANGTITNGAFAPTLYGYTENQLPSLTFSGFVSSGSDTGSNSVITFIGRRTSSSTDPMNGNFTAISTRPMFNFINNTTNLMTILATGLVGINETSPTAQLQVKSGAIDRVPLIVDTLASHTGLLQSWRVNGGTLAYVTNGGRFASKDGIQNNISPNNSYVITDVAGTTIYRDVNDSNPALRVNQQNASSTGDIVQFRRAGTTQATIARDGIANFTGTPSNEQTSDYTLVLADKGKVLRVNSSSNRTITIPLNSSVAFPIDTEIALIRYGSGTVSISPTSGVTLNSISSNRKVKDRYGSCALKKIGTDEWVLVGSLEA
jgi:hypothetical protein